LRCRSCQCGLRGVGPSGGRRGRVRGVAWGRSGRCRTRGFALACAPRLVDGCDFRLAERSLVEGEFIQRESRSTRRLPNHKRCGIVQIAAVPCSCRGGAHLLSIDVKPRDICGTVDDDRKMFPLGAGDPRVRRWQAVRPALHDIQQSVCKKQGVPNLRAGVTLVDDVTDTGGRVPARHPAFDREVAGAHVEVGLGWRYSVARAGAGVELACPGDHAGYRHGVSRQRQVVGKAGKVLRRCSRGFVEGPPRHQVCRRGHTTSRRCCSFFARSNICGSVLSHCSATSQGAGKHRTDAEHTLRPTFGCTVQTCSRHLRHHLLLPPELACWCLSASPVQCRCRDELPRHRPAPVP